MNPLKLVYDRYSKKEGFPKGYCAEVSIVLERFGLHRRGGWFLLDRPMPNKKDLGYLIEDHQWNMDHTGKIVDLTLVQFQDALDEVVDPGILVIGPDHPFFERYLPKEINMSDYKVK